MLHRSLSSVKHTTEFNNKKGRPDEQYYFGPKFPVFNRFRILGFSFNNRLYNRIANQSDESLYGEEYEKSQQDLVEASH
jgi:hypothetical protein